MGVREYLVQAFRLGSGLVMVGLPGEPFTVTGQRIRATGADAALV